MCTYMTVLYLSAFASYWLVIIFGNWLPVCFGKLAPSRLWGWTPSVLDVSLETVPFLVSIIREVCDDGGWTNE